MALEISKSLDEKLNNPQEGDEFDTLINGKVVILKRDYDMVQFRYDKFGTKHRMGVDELSARFKSDAEAALRERK